MNAWDFMHRHPFVTLLAVDSLFTNACKLVNNIALYHAMGKIGDYEEEITTETEVTSEDEPDVATEES